VQMPKERKYIADCIRGLLPDLGLQRKKELCFGRNIDDGNTYLEPSRLLTLGMTIHSLDGK